MKVKFDKSNIYTTGNLYKAANGVLSVGGAVNCQGSLTVVGGSSNITSQSSKSAYSIAVRGPATLRNGRSNRDIYYQSTVVKSSWDLEDYNLIKFNSLPGMQDQSDLEGFLYYLDSLVVSGTSTHSGAVYSLKGRRTKSLNVFELDVNTSLNNVGINISIPATAGALLKFNSQGQVVAFNSVSMSSNTPNSAIICSIDCNSLSISNSHLIGTIYAPNSNVTLTDSVIDGAIYAKSLTIVGNCTINESLLAVSFEATTAPEIEVQPKASINNYEPVTVSISTVDNETIPDYYEIRYTLDGTDPTKESNLYTGSFDLMSIGLVTVKAKLFGNGVADGNSASQAYGFNCKTAKPKLIKTENLDGTVSYSIYRESGVTVYYTLDGSIPSENAKKYTTDNEFNNEFSNEGLYELRFFGKSENCDPSDQVYEELLIELQSKNLLPPVVKIWMMSNGNKVGLPINVSMSDLTGEFTLQNTYSIDDANNLAAFLYPSNPSDGSVIRYSISSSPAKDYTLETPIYLKDISTSLRAYSHIKFVEYSNQLNYTFMIKTSGVVNFDISARTDKSDEVRDALQTGASYAMDIAWVGPGIVTDDFAVYQALINILATQVLERVFNPRFGITLPAKIGSIDSNTDATKLLDELKYEVESQDPRIKIDEYKSDLYYDDSVNGIVVHLVWTNLKTNNTASVKYAFDLDTIV